MAPARERHATGVAGGTTHTKLPDAGRVGAGAVPRRGVTARRAGRDLVRGAGSPIGAPRRSSPTRTSSAVSSSISLVLAVALAFGEAGRTYLLTGDIWTTWGACRSAMRVPAVPDLVHGHDALAHVPQHGRAARRGAAPHPDLCEPSARLEIASWPSVTIQIPIFRESFEDAIRPTLDAAREAARRYREQTGARCNVLVCEDGLLYFAQERPRGRARRGAPHPPARTQRRPEASCSRAWRTTNAFDVAFVARPFPEPGVPGTERAGTVPQGEQPELHAAARGSSRGRRAALRSARAFPRRGARARLRARTLARATCASARSSSSSTRTA